MDYEADDLFKLWQFQDMVNNHSEVLLTKGIELGILAMTVEMSKVAILEGTVSQDSIDKARAQATAFAVTELKKRMKDARGPQAS
jgi:hypothetical protein